MNIIIQPPDESIFWPCVPQDERVAHLIPPHFFPFRVQAYCSLVPLSAIDPVPTSIRITCAENHSHSGGRFSLTRAIVTERVFPMGLAEISPRRGEIHDSPCFLNTFSLKPVGGSSPGGLLKRFNLSSTHRYRSCGFREKIRNKNHHALKNFATPPNRLEKREASPLQGGAHFPLKTSRPRGEVRDPRGDFFPLSESRSTTGGKP